MPRSYSIDEIFGPQTAPETAPTEDEGRSYSIDEIFSSAPQKGAPPQVVPQDALGLPPDYQEPSGVTKFAERFTEELPGVVTDLAQAGKGIIRDTLWGEMTPDEKSAGKRLFEDLRSNQATRAPLQGALQFSNTVQSAILRPLALAGVKGADAGADQAGRVVKALGEENTRKAASGIIAQTLGETAGQISENVISSLAEQFMGGSAIKGAKIANSATRAAMIYTGLSAGDRALTEATDMGLDGAKRWGYAGTVGGLNSAFIALGGKVAQKLGLETAEEALLGDIQPMISTLFARHGVTKALTALARGTGGAALEAGEEAGTELSTGITRAVFGGEPDGALDRVVAKLRDPRFQKDVVVAGLTGAAARGAIGAAKNLATALQSASERLPSALTQLSERVQARKVQEAPAEPAQPSAEPAQPSAEPAQPSAEPAQPSASPAQPPAGLAVPPETTAPPQAPQGPPLAPAQEAAAAAPPGVEPDAGTPPAEPPAGPPGAPTEPPAGFQMANAPMEQLARSLGRGESYYSPGTRGLREAAELAVQAKVPERALDIATDILENKRPLTSVEEAGLGLRVQQISSRLQENRSRMSQATDEVEIRSLSAEANNLGEDFDTLKEALQLGGTDPARLLAYRRWMFPDDLTEENIVARLKTARKGPSVEADKEFAKTVATEHQKTAKQLDAARQKQKESIAKEAVSKMKEEGPPTEELQSILARIQQLMQEGCETA